MAANKFKSEAEINFWRELLCRHTQIPQNSSHGSADFTKMDQNIAGSFQRI